MTTRIAISRPRAESPRRNRRGGEPRTFWYGFRNDGDAPACFEHNMGIAGIDGRPKPAGIAFATTSRVLRPVHGLFPLSGYNGVLAYVVNGRRSHAEHSSRIEG